MGSQFTWGFIRLNRTNNLACRPSKLFMSHELRQAHEHDNDSAQDEKQAAPATGAKTKPEASKRDVARDAAWAEFPRECAFDRH